MCIAAGPERTIGTSAISMTPAGVRLAGASLNPALSIAATQGPHEGGAGACVMQGLRLWAGVHAGNGRAQRSNDDILCDGGNPAAGS